MNISFLTLILLAAWPFVSFMNNNQDDALIYGPSIGAYGVGFVVFVAILFFVARKILGMARQRQIAAVLGIGAVSTFLYLPLSSGLSALGLSLGSVRIAIWLVLTIAILMLVWRVLRNRQTQHVLVVVAAVMVAVPLLQFAMFLGSGRGPAQSVASSSTVSDRSLAQPSVYWLVFDAYARADVLEDYFGFDNSPFLNALKERGFMVADQAWANYASTKLSLSTTASMEYYLPLDTALHPSMWTARLQGFNPVVERFQAMGYRYVHIEPGGNNLKTRCGGREDICVTASPVGVFSVNEAEVGLLELTPLFPIVRRLFPGLLSFDFTTINDVLVQLDTIPARPQFVFAHILSPHPPKRFDARCGRLTKIEFDLAGDDYAAVLDGYINDLGCLNPRIIALVDRLIEDDTSDPIVIVQSDHGLRADLPPSVGDVEKRVSQALVPYANLHAMRTPGRCDSTHGEEFSLVNTFRIVFACIDQAPPDLLPNRRFGSQKNGLFEIRVGENPPS
jgi:hypothetical protein